MEWRARGVAYDPARDLLLVAGEAGTGAKVVRLDDERDPRGIFRVSRVADPATLAFDATVDELTAIDGESRVDISGEHIRRRRPPTARTSIEALGLRAPSSASFDPDRGIWYVLETESNTVAMILPEGQSAGPARLRLPRLGDARAIAYNTADDLLYVLAPSRERLVAIDLTGDIHKSFDTTSLGLIAPESMAFAPSTDRTDDSATLNLFVADSGNGNSLGNVTEVSLEAVVAAATTLDTGTLIQMIPTSAWNPGSPDPAGITWMPGSDQLVVVDSEVDEQTGAGWHNVNMWRSTRTGTVVGTGTMWGPNAPLFDGDRGFSREPTGAGYSPVSNTLFVSDDDDDRVYVMQTGPDGQFGTLDDPVGSINAGAVGSGDTEDPEFDSTTGHLFFLDGVSREVFRVNPVDGTFGNGNDVITHFDISHLGPSDFEGLAIAPGRATLYVGARATGDIFEITHDGTLLRSISVDAISQLRYISGLAVAPSSNGSGQMSLWIVDRAVDNGANPNENDGKIFEISAPNIGGPVQNQPPTVTAGPDQTVVIAAGASLNGTVGDDGLPNPPGAVTTTWTETSGPGNVTFGNPNAVDTTASFSQAGTYVLRLTANDSALTAFDEVTITVAPANQTPTVSAGPDVAVSQTAGASLNGTVTDDGLPNPPGAVTTTWTETSGPGNVTFANSNAVDTTASFSQAGTYVLRLTANDSALTAFDEVTITVNPVVNQTPTVSAGPDVAVSQTSGASLNGTVSDDGLPNPPGTLTTTWSQVSGPGSVTFGNANAVDTTANFSATGSYVLRLTANDSQLQASDDVTITVTSASVVETRVAVGNDDAEESATGTVDLTSSDLELVFDGGNQTVGMRFAGLGIPAGATIISAYVQFTVDETPSNATSLIVQAQAVDNAATFTTAAFGISSRPRTSAAVNWSPPAWPVIGVAGPDQRTPDLTTVIQEVVSRPGWTSGNALAIIVTGTGERVAEARNAGATLAPLLHVEYTTSTQLRPVVNAGSDLGVTLGDPANLDGTVTDDGLPDPPAAVIATWTKVSGPGNVTFGNANAVDTTATFSAAGNYVLRLTASDSQLSASDDVAVTVNLPPGTVVTVEAPVAASADDAEESAAGSVNISDGDLELVLDNSGGNQTVGMRFAGMQIPDGATIVNAWVQLVADEAHSGATNLVVRGQAADQAAAFTTAPSSISTRPRTTASVAWVPPAWTIGAAGTAQRTPNLAGVIQEVVDRPGWVGGNPIVILVTGTGKRTAESRNGGGPTLAPVLHVEYLVP